MERVGAGRPGRVDDGQGVEQVDGRPPVLPRDDDVDPELGAGPADARRDLAPIRDEQGSDGLCASALDTRTRLVERV